jgi:hypothetical protein
MLDLTVCLNVKLLAVNTHGADCLIDNRPVTANNIWPKRHTKFIYLFYYEIVLLSNP